MAPPKSSPLVEGLDYYRESESLVFTETFLLKRGYCCNSGCRHCPYKAAAANFKLEIHGVGGSSGADE